MSPYPSPLRASAGKLAPFVLLAGGLGAVVGLRSPLGGVLVAASVLAIVGSMELQAALRLNWALREFARQIPGDPAAETSYWGDQSVRWPDLGLEASGSTHRFRVRGLRIEGPDTSRSASTLRPREAARETLAALDREPNFDRFEDRLPSVYSRLSAARAGAVTAAGATVLAAVAVRNGSTAVAVGAIAGGLTALGRWAGLRRVRGGLVALAEGLAAGGVEVGRIDLVRGIVFQTFEGHTAAGAVSIRATAHPWGKIAAQVGDRTVRGRLSTAREVGRDLAAALSRASRPADRERPSEHVRVASTRRLSSLGFGTAFVALGLVLALRPALVVSGDCRGADCLLADFLGVVPFGHALFGGLLVVLGLATLAVAFAGSMPADAHRWWARRYR